MLALRRISIEVNDAQAGLIKEDMIAKIKKEWWTGRGTFHLFSDHVRKGKGQGQVFALQRIR